MYDIVSIGDSTIDHFFFIHDASVNCDIKKEECRLIMNFADKIAVDKYKMFTAGNAANNAVASSMLGLKTAFYTALGEDNGGDELLSVFKKHKVSLEYIQKDKKNPTNISAVISFQGERTILVYHVPRKYNLPKNIKTKWIYLTSLGPKLTVPVLHKQVLDFLNKNPKVKMGFNPGTHQMNLGFKALKPLLKRTETLFMNKEEYERVLGMPGKIIKELLVEMKKHGPSVCVLTDGPKGSYVYDGKDFRYLEIFDTPVVERTGCGDAFGSAFVAAQIYGLGIDEAMRWGTMNSAYVIQEAGPQNGLLTKQKIISLLKKNKNFKPRKI